MTGHPTIDYANWTLPEAYAMDLADAVAVPVCIPDISIWQGDVDVDKFIGAGAHGVIIRAGSINNTTGICYEDDQFQNNIVRFAGRLPMGSYWYFRPNHDPIKQADYFADLLERNEWNIPPIADVEVNPNNNSAYDFGRWLNKFISRLQYLCEVVPMIYTRGFFWNDFVYGSTSPWAHACPLWIARYTTYPLPWGNGTESIKYRPFDWDAWDLWQWSADKNGRGAEFGAESADIDLNRFNGSLADFHAWCNWNQVEPPEPGNGCCCGDMLASIEQSAKEILQKIADWKN